MEAVERYVNELAELEDKLQKEPLLARLKKAKKDRTEVQEKSDLFMYSEKDFAASHGYIRSFESLQKWLGVKIRKVKTEEDSPEQVKINVSKRQNPIQIETELGELQIQDKE